MTIRSYRRLFGARRQLSRATLLLLALLAMLGAFAWTTLTGATKADMAPPDWTVGPLPEAPVTDLWGPG